MTHLTDHDARLPVRLVRVAHHFDRFRRQLVALVRVTHISGIGDAGQVRYVGVAHTR